MEDWTHSSNNQGAMLELIQEVVGFALNRGNLGNHHRHLILLPLRIPRKNMIMEFKRYHKP